MVKLPFLYIFKIKPIGWPFFTVFPFHAPLSDVWAERFRLIKRLNAIANRDFMLLRLMDRITIKELNRMKYQSYSFTLSFISIEKCNHFLLVPTFSFSKMAFFLKYLSE